MISPSFRNNSASMSILTGATPGVQFYVLKKVFFTAQVPLTTHKFSLVKLRDFDPARPVEQQSTVNYNFDSPVFSNWAFRLGVGIKL